MRRLCDVCHGVYSNNSSFSAHQRKTGHKQIASTDGEIVELTDNLVQLQDSLKGKDASIAQLNDSLKTKDDLIATLEDSIKTKDAEFATLHDEIAQLSSLEHEQDIVRHTLKSLNKEAYDVIGQQLGFVEVPKPQPATVEDSTTQHRAEATRDAHNAEAASSTLAPATTEPVVVPVSDNKPVEEPSIVFHEMKDSRWTWYPALGYSIKN